MLYVRKEIRDAAKLGDKEMQTKKTFSRLTTIFIVVLLLASTMLLINLATAQTERKFTPYLSFRPNPVGVGQPVLVNFWTTPSYNTQLHDYTVTITKPDGTQVIKKMDPVKTDATAWFEYIPDQVGNYTLQFNHPQEIIGNYTFPAVSTGVQKLTVQQEMVGSWPASSIPTDYWTRPGSFQNREWWPILGDWPWYGTGHTDPRWYEYYPDTNPTSNAIYRFTPWVQGPESAHIVWKRQLVLGGIMGGDYGIGLENLDIYSMSSSWGRPNIVYDGMAHHFITKSGSGKTAPTYWMCYDVRTGELAWERPLEDGETAPTYIEYQAKVKPSGGGDTESAGALFLSVSGGYMRKYDPFTGRMTLNRTLPGNLTGTGGTYYMNAHFLIVQNLGSSVPAAQRYRLINWTSSGNGAIVSNTSYARSSMPSFIDWNVNLGANVQTGTVEGVDLLTGVSLWNATITDTPWQTVHIADHGKIAVIMYGGYYKAWNLNNGQLAWTSEKMGYPWDEPPFGAYATMSAYGLLIRPGYSGIYAFNWTDGKIVWKYEAPAKYPYDSPYVNEEGEGVYSWNVEGWMADGKLYIYNTEHSATVPITRGWGLHCINMTTGEGIWNVTISGAGSKHSSDLRVIADGYLFHFSGDGYMYVFGKGRSQTTVSAPSTAVNVGQQFTITGTVVDLSPGQEGTPAISDNDMASWMEYLHQNMPKPTNAKGVTVQLTALDPNNNCIEIGEAISDINGAFGLTWAPEVPGLYQIVATFPGSDSYGSSSASTYLSAIEAPAEQAIVIEPEPDEPSIADTYFVPAIAGIIAAIAIVGVLLAVLLLKKR
jgi:hypothetical protein